MKKALIFFQGVTKGIIVSTILYAMAALIVLAINPSHFNVFIVKYIDYKGISVLEAGIGFYLIILLYGVNEIRIDNKKNRTSSTQIEVTIDQ